MNTSRPAAVTTAAVLLLLLSLFGLISPLLPLANKPPLPVTIFGLVAGISGLIAIAGLWGLKRWSWGLSVILSAVGALVAVPGIFAAPDLAGKSVSVGLIVGYGLVLVCVVLPAARAAFAAQRARLAA